MFADFLKRLVEPGPAPLPDADARLALTALLVRVARSDESYDEAERALYLIPPAGATIAQLAPTFCQSVRSGVSCAADSNGGSASVLNARRRRLDDTASATVSFTLTVSAGAGDRLPAH